MDAIEALGRFSDWLMWDVLVVLVFSAALLVAGFALLVVDVLLRRLR